MYKEQCERIQKLKEDIRPIKAGPKFKATKERLHREQLRAFLARQDLID